MVTSHTIFSSCNYDNRPGLHPGHVVFVVDKVALGQVFLRVLRFCPVSMIPPSSPTHIIWGMNNMSVSLSVMADTSMSQLSFTCIDARL
jgi:hypothetical protein